MDYPALPAYAIALVALFLKTTLTSALQVISRARSRAFLLPEDAAMMRTKVSASETLFVQRCAGVWRNDAENLPLFLVLALTWVLLGAPLGSAQVLFSLFVAIRYLHTVVYLRGLQPARTVCFLAGLVVCWIIATKIVYRLLADAALVG